MNLFILFCGAELLLGLRPGRYVVKNLVLLGLQPAFIQTCSGAVVSFFFGEILLLYAVASQPFTPAAGFYSASPWGKSNCNVAGGGGQSDITL